VGSSPLASEPPFDLAIAFGVLHHLDDAQADHLFAEARRLLRRNGRLVTYDGCWVEGQSRIARWLISMDRGQAVRAPRDLERLATPHFSEIRREIRHDFLRIPYTHVVLECSNTRPSPPPAT
jgi:SAM-dependent methyltransferase